MSDLGVRMHPVEGVVVEEVMCEGQHRRVVLSVIVIWAPLAARQSPSVLDMGSVWPDILHVAHSCTKVPALLHTWGLTSMAQIALPLEEEIVQEEAEEGLVCNSKDGSLTNYKDLQTHSLVSGEDPVA